MTQMNLPNLSWSDFLRAAPYFTSLAQEKLQQEDAPHAPDLLRALYYYEVFEGEVCNGGVAQYYFNQALYMPAFNQAADFMAVHPVLAQQFPEVLAMAREVHAFWTEAEADVRQARDTDEWPEELFNKYAPRFEAIERQFYAVNHHVSQSLCAHLVQQPEAYFTMMPTSAPAKGLAHVVSEDGAEHLRFVDGFPLGPNIFERKTGGCNVVWFSPDRQLMQCERLSYGATTNRDWIHYPSKTSGTLSFKGNRLEKTEASRSLWRKHGLTEYYNGKGQRTDSKIYLEDKELCWDMFYSNGTLLRRSSQQGEIKVIERYWQNGKLNTRCEEDKHRHERTTHCLDEQGENLAPGGNGKFHEFLTIEKGRHKWREGQLVKGYVEGEVRWMSSKPDGSDMRTDSRAQFKRGKEV